MDSLAIKTVQWAFHMIHQKVQDQESIEYGLELTVDGIRPRHTRGGELNG